MEKTCVLFLVLLCFTSVDGLRTQFLSQKRSEGALQKDNEDTLFRVPTIRDMLKTMSLDKAKSVLGGSLPSAIKNLLTTKKAFRGPDAPAPEAKENNAIGKAAPTSQPPCEKCKKISADQKTKDEALKVLNEIIREEVKEHDIVEKECVEKVTTLREEVTTLSEEIKTVESDIDTQVGRIAKETGKINEAQNEITEIKNSLEEHEKTCTTIITEIKSQLDEITLKENAANVLKNATTCVKPAEGAAKGMSLVQCRSPSGASLLTFADPKLHKMRVQLGKHVHLALLQEPVADPNEDMESVLRRCKVKNPEEIEGITGGILDKPVPVDCGILNEEFSRTAGEITDERRTVEETLRTEETTCTEITKKFTDEITHWEDVINTADSELADAVSEKTRNTELLEEKTTTKTTVVTELTTTTKDCTERITHVLTRICSIEKIREELNVAPDALPPQDCVVGDWREGECLDLNTQMPKTCGGGTQVVRRGVLVPEARGGVPCPALEEARVCNDHPCPVDCEASTWSAWGQCNAPCGGGVQLRGREVIRSPAHNGQPCGALQEEQVCNSGSCDAPCVLGDFGEWSSCSKACKADADDVSGTQARSRIIAVPATGHGTCPAPGTAERSEAQACNTNLCPLRPVCSAKLDVVILIDSSGSIGRYNFGRATEFLHHLIGRFQMDGTHVQASLVRFADDVSVIMPMTSDKQALSSAITNMEWTRGGTNTAGGLEAANSQLMMGRTDASSIVFVLTDGEPDEPSLALQAAHQLKADAARVFFVMASRYKPVETLREMATAPADENVMRVSGYRNLDNKLRSMLVTMCPVITTADPGKSCTVNSADLPSADTNTALYDSDDKEYKAGASVEDGRTLFVRCSKMDCFPASSARMSAALCDNGVLGMISHMDRCTCGTFDLPPIGLPPI